MADERKNRLTEDEEALLREFEAERVRQKTVMEKEVEQEVRNELAEEVKAVMEKEIEGAMTAEVKKAVDEEMDAKVRQEVELGIIGGKTDIPDAEAVKKKMEEEIRGRIEAETREKIEGELRKKLEDEARKKFEDSRAELEAKIRKEMEENEKAKKEDVLKRLQAFKQIEDENRRSHEEELKVKLKQEMEKEIEEKEKRRKDEILKKLSQIEKVEHETKKLQEEEIKNKMREEIKLEMEEERKKKKQEILSKLDAVKTQSAAMQFKLNEITLNYNEQTSMINLFEESQKMLASFLTTRIDRKDAASMFFKAVLSAEKKHPDVLKRAMIDRTGSLRQDGTLEAARLIANINALQLADADKTKRFLAALREIFEERLIAAEVATSMQIKEAIMSQLLDQLKKTTARGIFPKKVTDIFMSSVVPSTTLMQGE